MKTIRKHEQNVWIDTISLIGMIILIVTGILLKYKLQPGSHGDELWGFSRHQWGDFHFWVAIFMVVAISLHLLLHIPWIKQAVYPKNNAHNKERAFFFSIGFGLLLIASFLVLIGTVTQH